MTNVPEPKALRAKAAALRNAAKSQRADNASGGSPLNFGDDYHEMTVQGLDREAAMLDARADQIEADD